MFNQAKHAGIVLGFRNTSIYESFAGKGSGYKIQDGNTGDTCFYVSFNLSENEQAQLSSAAKLFKDSGVDSNAVCSEEASSAMI